MSSARIIRWGILGTSKISETMAAAIQKSSTGRLAAIGSRANAEKFVASISKDDPDLASIKQFNDFQQLIDDRDIDAVYIGLPHHLHYEWTLKAVKAGKHVLCEKPFLISPSNDPHSEAERMDEIIWEVTKLDVVCMEALMYRYHPFIKQLENLIKDGFVGDVKLYRAIYTYDIVNLINPAESGAMRSLGCYPISLVRLLAGAEPTEIRANGRTNSNGMDLQANIVLNFADESVALISTAIDMNTHAQFEIHGTKGILKVTSNPFLPDENNNKMMFSAHDGETFELDVTAATKPLYSYQIDAVGDAIVKGNFIHNKGAETLLDIKGNAKVVETCLREVKAANYVGKFERAATVGISIPSSVTLNQMIHWGSEATEKVLKRDHDISQEYRYEAARL